MEFKVRKFKKEDKIEILEMMKEFYNSDAVYTNGSDEIFETDFETCLDNSPFLEGFVFYNSNSILGYAMLAKSFSTEFGKTCILIEDIYLKESYRNKGIIGKFIECIKKLYPKSIFKLEVENENTHAIYVYGKYGFKKSPYIGMINNCNN